jgi:hypothetical protein
MMRQVIALFDEYQIRENSKHILRAKGKCPAGLLQWSSRYLGYTAEACETRGERVKKRLIEDPVEAKTVRLIFRLYRVGDGVSGRLGVKVLTSWLNGKSYRTRLGARFGVATVHGILTNRVYIGESTFNQIAAQTGAVKPASEHVQIEVPALITREEFETVAGTLKAHNPRVTPVREVSGPILLTGLATCAHCRGAMTLRTGTSKSGKVFRYYSCSTTVGRARPVAGGVPSPCMSSTSSSPIISPASCSRPTGSKRLLPRSGQDVRPSRRRSMGESAP